MTNLVRIKGAIINLDNVTYVEEINYKAMEQPHGLVNRKHIEVGFYNGNTKNFINITADDFEKAIKGE